MLVSLRYADPHTASAYPLECNEQLDWHVAGNVHAASIKLPELPADAIVVPSITLLTNDDYRFQFTLKLGGNCWALQPVPSNARSKADPDPDPAVSTHIDCFHTHAPIRGARLEIEVVGLSQPCPYLVTATARALRLDDLPAPTASVRCEAPPAISQMTMGQTLGPRICSPTCTTMLLAMFGRNPDLEKVSQACFDPVTQLYGVWPLALRAASKAGCLGAVEVFGDWLGPQQAIAAGLPVIASIRFADNALPDSPLRATPGHLVVVYGIGPDEVLVCDPAAPDSASVPRRYDAASFGRAWFQHRGATYILLP